MIKFIIISVSLLILIHVSTGLQGGSPAEQGQFPAHVSVRIGNTFCGGTILDRIHVITAARCILNDQNHLVAANQTAIIAGIIDLTNTVETFAVSAIYPHPHFDPITLEHDIAILMITSNFTFNEEIPNPSIYPAILNQRIVPDESVCLIPGWNPPTPNAPVSQLQFVNMHIMNRQDNCNAMSIHAGRVRDTMICAEDTAPQNPARLCVSTRGGGIYCNNLLTGIASFGFTCGEQTVVPAVFTQIRMYRDWITQQFTRTDIPLPGPTPAPGGPGKASSIVGSLFLVILMAIATTA